MKMAKKKKSLLKQVIALCICACTVSMIVLGIAQAFLIGINFRDRLKYDLNFYLKSTTDHMKEHITSLEKIIISFRNSWTIERFLEGNEVDQNHLSQEFAVATDLYSETNLNNSSVPFIKCIYLFNNEGQWISNQIYPQTAEGTIQQNTMFTKLRRIFLHSQKNYQYISTADSCYICSYVYDNDMNITGTCIISISPAFIAEIYEGANRYKDQAWYIVGDNNEVVLSNQKGKEIADLREEGKVLPNHQQTIGTGKYETYSDSMGLGLRSVLLVNDQDIQLSVVSMLLPFLAVFCIILAVASLAVLFVAVRITRPIKLMGEDIQKFNTKEHDVRMREFGVQEFDEVSRLYNDMTAQIQYLVGKVYEKQLLTTQAQVKYLQSQINPHFMFNILSMLSIKAGLKHDKDLQNLLSAFAKLIQGKIFKKGEILIPLREEMEIVEFYLMLQSERFTGKIDYQIDCDPGLKNVHIPRLLIEPLVENAVSHGLEPKIENGTVSVTIRQKGNNLLIQVRDDGVGFNVEELADKEKIIADEKHTHIGIENTRLLLNVLYGSDATMNIESTVDIGTTITIELPIEWSDHNVESNAR